MTAARAAGGKPGVTAPGEVEGSGLTARRPEFGVTPR